MVEEKKRRVDALEKYVENNYGDSKNQAPPSESRGSVEAQFDSDKKAKYDDSSAKLVGNLPNDKPQQFRRNMYLKTQSTGEKTVADSEQDSEYRNLSRMKILNSFEKELDTLAEDQIDVEEMHYFFVNFHQKSKLLMSKMK
jgi:hypothetical protein